ncbi:MAG TPA: cytochrome c [Xanthobacteraceae bacterium]|nr:cytochrome c [Xanthobacteraceae bacterium]
MKIASRIGLVAAVMATTMPSWRPAFAEEATQTAIAEPEAAEAELAAKGKALYAHHCSHCHGFNMVNAGTIAFDLRQFPHDNKARFVHSVTTGKNGRMPAWGDLLSAGDIDQLWAYIKTGGAQ